MSGFLLDEHIPKALGVNLRQREPDISIFRVGDDLAPPITTDDPELLKWIDEHDCFLVTQNRSTMPMHLEAHISQGGHVPGIVQLPRRIHIPSIVEDLLLLWEASLPGEFRDQIIYLPLSH